MPRELKPIETAEMLVMQERCYALANNMDAFAEELRTDPHVEDAEYVAGMMRLSAKKVRMQGRDLEDDDDIDKIDMFLSANELEIDRGRTKMAEARTAHERGEHHDKRAKDAWLVAKIFGGISAGVFLLSSGFLLGRLVSGAL